MMSRAMIGARIVHVEPIETATSPGFVERAGGRSGFDEKIETPIYPPSPNGLAIREYRQSLDLGLREAAVILGLPPSLLSRLESGQSVFENNAHWQVLMNALKEGATR